MSGAEAFWIAALLASVCFVTCAAQLRGLDRRTAYLAGLGALAGGLIGGALLGLFDYGWEDHTWNLFARGKSFCGGLVGGATAAALFLAWRKVSISKYGDILVTALALGYAIGRIGCFLNGCDFGIRTDLPWGVQYPPGTEAYGDHLSHGWIVPGAGSSLPVHPVQLYAAACGALILFVLLLTKEGAPGKRLAGFALLYGAYRFPMEWLRGDFKAFAGPFSLPQVVSLSLIISGGAGWWILRQRIGRGAPDHSGSTGKPAEPTQPDSAMMVRSSRPVS